MTDRRGRIVRALHDVFVYVFDDDDIQIREDLTAHDIDEWDSLSHITLVVAIESRFGIKFKTSELSGLKNVGEMIDLIDAKAADDKLDRA